MPITRRPAIPLTLSAFTLIEVVIGLGIIVAVMLLWSPLLTGVQRFTNGHQSKFYVFEFYTKNGNSMIRARTNDGGHIPLFMQIKSGQFLGSVHGFLYEIRLGTNQTFEGGVRLNQ